MGWADKQRQKQREAQAAAGIPIIGAGRIPTQPAEVRDGYGRVIEVGDLVQLPLQSVVHYSVTQIEPVYEDGVPPGLMDVTLVARVKLRTPRGQRTEEILRILTRGEAQEIGLLPKPKPEVPEEEQPEDPPPAYVAHPEEEPPS